MEENKEIWFKEIGFDIKPQRAKVLQRLKDGYDVNHFLVNHNGFLRLVNIKDVCKDDEVETLKKKEQLENKIKELEEQMRLIK